MLILWQNATDKNFLNNEKARKSTKIFLGVAALADETARGLKSGATGTGALLLF